MSMTASQVNEISTDEVRLVAVSFAGKLDSGELLTGTPTVTAETGSGLVLSTKVINDTAITVNGTSVAIGEAVQFKADATAANGGRWAIEITCGTDAGQTLYGRIIAQVIET